MEHWISFAIVVVIQAAVLFLVELNEHTFNRGDRREQNIYSLALVSVTAGIAVGFLFDWLVGHGLSLFQYHLHSPIFTIANGGLSYGFAIATALRFAPSPVVAQRSSIAIGELLLGTICIGLLALATWRPDPMALAWAAGGILIFSGEVFEKHAFGTKGPFLEALSGHIRRPFRNWLTAVFVGCSYEIANFYFPVWTWWFEGSNNALAYELFIIAFGYVVLLHVCRTIGLIGLSLVRKLMGSTSTGADRI
jgi:hypothetical protein